MPSPQDARPLFRVLDAETGEEVFGEWFLDEWGAIYKRNTREVIAFASGTERYRIEWAAPRGEDAGEVLDSFLSTRAKNALYAANIYTKEQARKIGRSSLLGYKNIGLTTAHEVWAWAKADARPSLEDQLAASRSEVAALTEERDRLRAALSFYADPKNYEAYSDESDMDYCPAEVIEDDGKRARAALSPQEPSGSAAEERQP